jgi:hypothetical protein
MRFRVGTFQFAFQMRDIGFTRGSRILDYSNDWEKYKKKIHECAGGTSEI